MVDGAPGWVVASRRRAPPRGPAWQPALAARAAAALLVVGPLGGCGDDGGGGAGGSGGGSPAAASGATADAGAGPGGTSGAGASGAGATGPSSSTVGPGAGGGAACIEDAIRTGEGTWYDADGTGNCSFDATDAPVAALNDPDYDGAAWCGACAAVDGPDGAVTVRIVDRCPECAAGDLDLSQGAFAQIAPLEAGRVPITWRFVPCDVEGNLSFRFKEGSNPFWSAIQVRDHRHAIASLEAIDPASGAYVPLVRQDYNFFLWEAGLGEGPYTLRTTDVHGHVLVDEGVPFAEATTAPGAAQLPVCE